MPQCVNQACGASLSEDNANFCKRCGSAQQPTGGSRPSPYGAPPTHAPSYNNYPTTQYTAPPPPPQYSAAPTSGYLPNGPPQYSVPPPQYGSVAPPQYAYPPAPPPMRPSVPPPEERYHTKSGPSHRYSATGVGPAERYGTGGEGGFASNAHKPLCRYFNTPQGCQSMQRAGKPCGFRHGPPEPGDISATGALGRKRTFGDMDRAGVGAATIDAPVSVASRCVKIEGFDHVSFGAVKNHFESLGCYVTMLYGCLADGRPTMRMAGRLPERPLTGACYAEFADESHVQIALNQNNLSVGLMGVPYTLTVSRPMRCPEVFSGRTCGTFARFDQRCPLFHEDPAQQPAPPARNGMPSPELLEQADKASPPTVAPSEHGSKPCVSVRGVPSTCSLAVAQVALAKILGVSVIHASEHKGKTGSRTIVLVFDGEDSSKKAVTELDRRPVTLERGLPEQPLYVADMGTYSKALATFAPK